MKASPILNWAVPPSARTFLACCLLAVAVLALRPGVAGGRSDRLTLFPKLCTGQTFAYQISYRTDKRNQTQSNVVLAQAPPSGGSDVLALLRVEVLGVATQGPRAVIHVRTWFQPLDSSGKSSPAQSQNRNAATVECAIFPDGHFDKVSGLDDLSPQQQQAWEHWASRFVGAAAFPAEGIKIGQKWRTEEPERSPSPIAELTWIRESTYVRNEPCRPLRATPQGDFIESDQPPDTCAVILTTASLKQQSSAKDATPEDFRVRQLRTSGTAHGNNKTILYISLKTGLLVRASDEADQTMSITIAKADGSNHVHYDIQAKGAAELLLVANAPAKDP
jgi:hypothetical protein